MGAVPTDVFATKTYKRVTKLLGPDRAKELVQKSDGELKAVIGECVMQSEGLWNALDGNVEYLKAADVVDTLEGGVKDTIKPMTATINLAKTILRLRKE